MSERRDVLSTRDIKLICRKHGWHCQMERMIGSDHPLFCNHSYRHNNSVMVARGASPWLKLGWKWDIEILTEKEIADLLRQIGGKYGYNNVETSNNSDQATDHTLQQPY